MDELKRGVELVYSQCMGINHGEKLLIVTDTDTTALGDLFFDVAIGGGIEAEQLQYETLPMDGMEPPQNIAEAMLHSDVAILITSRSLTHTRARQAATEQGVRIASLPGFTESMLKKPMLVDYPEMSDLGQKVAELLTKAETARITTAFGADFTMSLKGRYGENDSGIYDTPGAFGNLPAGEAYIAPLEGTTNGLLVYDASMAGIGLLKEPLRITVKDGWAMEINGGSEAEALKIMLAAAGKPGTNIAELGIGTNPGAKVNGSVLEDEKVLGTIHIALGDNINFGGKVEASCHLDGILSAPDLWLDGVLVMKAGKLLI